MRRKFYGQHGEDSVLWQLFKNSVNPWVFLDVGALDGIHYSNTYSFELEDWIGICVEAHPMYADLCSKNRPKSHVVHAAVHDTNKDLCKFYANHRGSLSTLDKSNEKYFKKYSKYFGGFTEMAVPMRTINSILNEFNIIKVDIVSIDIEGNELAALRGFDIRKYSPEVLVIEAMLPQTEIALYNMMKKNGYYYAKKISNNMFFCKTMSQARLIYTASPVASSQIQRTVHPLDEKVN